MKNLMLVMLLTMGYCSGLFAQQPKVVTTDRSGWHKIGETTVDYDTDKDEIYVLGADAFSAVKFRVTEAPIHMMSMTIFFESGDNQTVTMGQEIAPEGESQHVELEGGERRIKKITYVYKTIPNNMDEKAEVELWGLKKRTE